jgi:UMF1 family MFS transporter
MTHEPDAPGVPPQPFIPTPAGDAVVPDPPARPPGPPLTGRALGADGPSSKRRVVAWAMWDWGTQPFNTVVTTFVFAVYITSDAFGETDSNSVALSISTAIAGFFIAALAPVLGQNADRSGHTVRTLRLLTWAVALICGGLYFIAPDPKYLWFGLGLLGLGTVASEIAGANYNSLITRVATQQNVGRVSGLTWGVGYLGGIVVLLAIYFLFINADAATHRTVIGFENTDSIGVRVSMIVCMAWTLLFTIPTFVSLRDRPPPAGSPPKTSFARSYVELGRGIRGLWRTQRQIVFFLLASALFRDGLAGVFAFGAVIASGTFGFDAGQIIIFGAAANVTAGVATIIVGWVDDWLGPKTVIMAALSTLVVSCVLVFVLHDRGPTVFWVLGLVMSACVGPAQASSRSFLARLVPEGRAGEIFGLYTTTGRVASFISPVLLAAMIGLGHVVLGPGAQAQHWGILGITVVLAAGLAVMIPVKPAGQQAQIDAGPDAAR